MAENLKEISDILQKTVPIAILCVGTVGNILSLSVLTRPKTRRFSTAVFLIALTIIDFIALWSGLMRLIISGYLKIDIRNVSTVMCKLHVFIVYTSTHISSWLIVGVTVERVVCVWMPVKIHNGSNYKAALIVTIATILTCVSINSHILVGFELRSFVVIQDLNLTLQICQPVLSESYIHFMDNIWPWLDLALLFLLPFCFLVFGNALIIIRVRMSRHLRRASCPDVALRLADTNSLYFLTALLVTLNVVFVVCVAPITIFIIMQYIWWPDVQLTEKEMAISGLGWVVTNILVYMNYAVNFILYLTCGSKFRAEFKSTFLCFKSISTRSVVGERRSASSSGSGSVCYISTSDILAS